MAMSVPNCSARSAMTEVTTHSPVYTRDVPLSATSDASGTHRLADPERGHPLDRLLGLRRDPPYDLGRGEHLLDPADALAADHHPGLHVALEGAAAHRRPLDPHPLQVRRVGVDESLH